MAPCWPWLSRGPRVGTQTPASSWFFLHPPLRTQMVTHGLKNRTAYCPNREGNKENHTDRAQPSRIQRFLGQGRLDKAGDIDLLSVGVHARAVEGLERMLICVLRESPLTFELLIRAHHP